MKYIVLFLVCALLFSGCSARETFETVDDEYVQSVMQESREILLSVSDDATVLEGDTGCLYLCDGYEVTAEILPAGNLSGTFQTVTGFGMDDLTVMETAAAEFARYECAFASVGEDGDMVGRAVILDDGVYHYCVCVMMDADNAAALQETMENILSSFALG